MTRKPRYFFDTIHADLRRFVKDHPVEIITTKAPTPEQREEMSREPGFMEIGRASDLIIGIDYADPKADRTMRWVKRRPPKEGDIPMTFNPAALSALASGNIANALQAASPGGIEAQEAEEQATLVNAFVTLPRDMSAYGREVAERLGFVFGANVDDLFVSVTAPEGWTYRATSHSMHNEILDAQGRVRGTVFYKGAFYDRRANGQWLTRYYPDWLIASKLPDDTPDLERATAYATVDRATGKRLWTSEVYWSPKGQGPDSRVEWDAYRKTEDATREAAKVWLDENFPGWADHVAYWDAD